MIESFSESQITDSFASLMGLPSKGIESVIQVIDFQSPRVQYSSQIFTAVVLEGEIVGFTDINETSENNSLS